MLAFQKVTQRESDGDTLLRAQGLASAKTRSAVMRLGDEQIEITEFVTPRGRPFPEDSRSNDRWFQHIAIIVNDMGRAHDRIHEKMVRHASKDPQRLPDWNKNAAGIKAFYFRDPDGHFLEILEFPPDKGNAKWHRKTDQLFLGIDHTAIVVDDTETSLRFYRDTLGLKVVGGSENYGTEQTALNNVPDAHLRITTLRAPAGPGIELLEYLSPRDGRPFPADARPNDILSWQTQLVVPTVSNFTRGLKQGGYRFVSDEGDRERGQLIDAGLTILARDPDGHAMEIVPK